jgi:inward rectifier potassium channel
MFRMANWRRNTILAAQLHVILLLEEMSEEGHVMRRPHDLAHGLRSQPAFALS